jgi:Rps23 Pro-64 3,4-dihydroxylase Tpa1-like proline 4-hydroxylase
VPFLRLRQPLHEAEHRALREVLLARLPGFRPARVRAVAEAPGGRDERRSAQVLMRLPPAIEPLRRLLWQRQAAALPALLGTTLDGVGLDGIGLEGGGLEGGGLELQATLSGEGDHYAAHRDSGDSATGGRLLTLVYYLHRQPRAFRGGALRLYDSDLHGGHWLGGGYTRIEPEDATLLLFPAAAWHEIEPVTDCADPANGRLTVNGWFRTAPPR